MRSKSTTEYQNTTESDFVPETVLEGRLGGRARKFVPLNFSVRKRHKDPKVEGSRSQQRSVMDHPPLFDCTETQ